MLRLRQVSSSPFSANKLSEHISAKVKVYRFLFLFPVYQASFSILSCFLFTSYCFWVHGATSNFNLGNSFIRRLAGFLQKMGHEHLMAKLSSLRSIRFHGVGGRTIAKVWKFDLGIIRRLSPDIIVLELGSND